ncbi:hypothetical protein NOF04DRAFT_1023363 [Fusarium oxysporum II5]|nr:hypothetical protein NOF04DRAFT_1023363 [Fusarium oxysporum II5]
MLMLMIMMMMASTTTLSAAPTYHRLCLRNLGVLRSLILRQSSIYKTVKMLISRPLTISTYLLKLLKALGVVSILGHPPFSSLQHMVKIFGLCQLTAEYFGSLKSLEKSNVFWRFMSGVPWMRVDFPYCRPIRVMGNETAILIVLQCPRQHLPLNPA